MQKKLTNRFYQQDVLDVAPRLLGQYLVRQFEDGHLLRLRITDVEAYRGEEDLACHASRGRTARTAVLYEPGGAIYVYLIYGMYWLLNIVTGRRDQPQALLIRGLEGIDGPGRVGRALELDASFYGESIVTGGRLWVEDTGRHHAFQTAPRIGIDYAGEWCGKPWRFYLPSATAKPKHRAAKQKAP